MNKTLNKKGQLTQEKLTSLGLSDDDATRIESSLLNWDGAAPLDFWRHVSRECLNPSMPFAIHQLLHQAVFSGWDESQGPAPAWSPTDSEVSSSNIGQMMTQGKFNNHEDFYQWSIDQPSDFVTQMASRLSIVFENDFDQALDLTQGIESPQWFAGAKMNIVQSCFQADSQAIAIKMQQTNGGIENITYENLQALVGQIVNGLRTQGVKEGDRVGLAMPMTVEGIAVYLGIVSLGCSAVTVAESFSMEEIKVRFALTKPVCVFTQDVIMRQSKALPLYDKVNASGDYQCIVVPAVGELQVALKDIDVTWQSFLASEESFDFAYMAPSDEMTVLFPSGTTGQPKAIPWDHTTALKAANDGHLHHDLHPRDVVSWPTSLGWMMGPWLVFATLINKGTIALNVDAPTTKAFGKFVQDAGVTMLGLVPSIVSAWRSSACMLGLDWKKIRAFSSTGECSNAEDMLYLMSLAHYKPIIEYCGGTEIGGGYITSVVVKPNVPGMFNTPALGSSWCLLDADNDEALIGEVFFKPPTLGCSVRLIQRDHHKVYFEGTPVLKAGAKEVVLRRHGDQIETMPDAYFRARGRVDDAMNLGGIKVSSIQIEELLQSHCSSLKEAAAIGVAPAGGGPDQLVVFVVMTGDELCVDLQKTLQGIIREQLNPLFKIQNVVRVETLPRTASNKIMRRELRANYKVEIIK